MAMKGPVNWLWVVAGLGTVMVGCAARTGQVANPIAITTGEYDRVFDASVETLRQMKFTVDRQDRRFGVISTRPRIASSVLEPWETDHARPGQMVQATLNHERRIVRVFIKPAGAESAGAAENDSEQATATAEDGAADQGDAMRDVAAYRLRVKVVVERRQIPQVQPSAASVTTLEFVRGRSAAHGTLTETGYRQAFWRPIGRDELMEKRLVLDILRRATSAPDKASNPPAAPTDSPDASADSPEPADAPPASSDSPHTPPAHPSP